MAKSPDERLAAAFQRLGRAGAAGSGEALWRSAGVDPATLAAVAEARAARAAAMLAGQSPKPPGPVAVDELAVAALRAAWELGGLVGAHLDDQGQLGRAELEEAARDVDALSEEHGLEGVCERLQVDPQELLLAARRGARQLAQQAPPGALETVGAPEQLAVGWLDGFCVLALSRRLARSGTDAA